MKLVEKGIFWVILALIIILIIGFFTFSGLKRRIEISTQIPLIEKEGQVQKGINFLLKTDEKFGGGTTFLVKEINKFCRDERLEKLWKEKLDEDISDRKFLYRLYDPVYQYSDIPDLENITDLNTRLIAKAAYCEMFVYEDILKDINTIKKDNAYNSSHLLLALAIIKERGCYDLSIIDTLIKELVEDLIIIQNNEGKSENLSHLCIPLSLDIYAERAAIIGYAGYPIEEVWVKNIIRCQAENGSWFDNLHTTTLALLAITQRNKNCE